MRLLGVGEILWDVFAESEHLGGAVFNLCAHAARLGHEVSLVSAVADDPRGRRALARARELGVSTRFIRTVPDAPTGIVTVTLDSAGQPSYKIERPAAYDFAELSDADLSRIAAAPPDWICFGTLHSMHPCAARLLRTVIDRCPQARRFYDVNLRKDSFTLDLLKNLLGLANIVKLNEAEVGTVQEALETHAGSLEQFSRNVAERLRCQAVCVTRGENGCAVLLGSEYVEVPGYRAEIVDAVGAGDAFAAALIHAIDAGLTPTEAAAFANRLGAFVASRPGAVPEWSLADLQSGPALP